MSSVLTVRYVCLNIEHCYYDYSKVLPEEELVVTKILIRAMVSARPHLRPPCETVLKYPMFWGKQSILNFLQVLIRQWSI